MESVRILEHIINKGGIMGACAKKCSGDKEKAEQFILECYHQCHNNSAVKLWGEELVIDIQNYIHIRKNEIIARKRNKKVPATGRDFLNNLM